MVRHWSKAVKAYCSAKATGHTILLVQPQADKYSRIYYDFDTLSDALGGVSQLFENQLREGNPDAPTLTYDVSDMFSFIDKLPDMSILVLDTRTNQYAPYGRTFIKNQLYKKLASNQPR